MLPVPELPESSPNPALSPAQHHVLAMLAEGHSLTDAAAQAGVHRNTIRNWRRAHPCFAREVEFAVRDQALVWHQHFVQLAPRAAEVLAAVLNNQDTAPALRLRAALAVLKIAAQPQPRAFIPVPAAAAEPQAAPDRIRFPSLPEFSAQSRTIRPPPDPARNSPCPCGSGQKYKRCCAVNAQSCTTAAAAA